MTAVGVVNGDLEATVALRLRGPSGIETETAAVVDTGYNGRIIVPAATCLALGLPRRARVNTRLADGSAVRVFTYTAAVLWVGVWREVIVSAVGAEPLVGTAFLDGLRLEVDFVPSGEVSVRPVGGGSGAGRPQVA